jgi:ABC-type multidrug transport system fused ATPase/permease subunit
LSRESKLTEDLKQFENLEGQNKELIEKLNDFMTLLSESKLDSNSLLSMKSKINTSLDNMINHENVIKEIQEVSDSDLDKLEQLNQLEFILNNNFIDSKQTKEHSFQDRLKRIVRIIIGFLFVTLGFAMIIMPAPPYFEMFTIFYFNQNDGVTLMDLISLIIILTGFYIVITTFTNRKLHE